jgi:hypothetical protein
MKFHHLGSSLLLALVTLNMVMIDTSFAAPTTSTPNTDLEVTPTLAAKCSSDSEILKNTIADIERINESATTVSFEFITVLGKCIHQRFKPVAMDTEDFEIRFVINRNQNMSFKTSPFFKIESELITSKFLKVKVTVDKINVFSSSNQVRYYMVFQPYGAFSSYYLWNLDLQLNSDHSTSLDVKLSH